MHIHNKEAYQVAHTLAHGKTKFFGYRKEGKKLQEIAKSIPNSEVSKKTAQLGKRVSKNTTALKIVPIIVVVAAAILIGGAIVLNAPLALGGLALIGGAALATHLLIQKQVTKSAKNYIKELNDSCLDQKISAPTPPPTNHEMEKKLKDSWLDQEISALTPPTNYEMEKEIIAQLGNMDVFIQKRKEAEVTALKKLYGKDFSLEELKNEAKQVRFAARMKAAKISTNQANQVKETLEYLEARKEELKRSSPNEMKLSKKIPPLGKKYILSKRKQLIEDKNTDLIQLMMKGCIAGIRTGSFTIESLKEKHSKNLEKRDYKFVDEELKQLIQFYEKYGRMIREEMIQGFENDDEDFNSGICHAKSAIWALEWQKKPDALKEKGQVEITSKVRFAQLLHKGSVNSTLLNKDLHNRFERDYPRAFRKFLGFKSVKSVALFKVTQDNLKDNLKKSMKQGVFLLSYGGGRGRHTVAVHCEVKNGRLNAHVGNVNNGLTEISKDTSLREQKEHFIDFLIDSMKQDVGNVTYFEINELII